MTEEFLASKRQIPEGVIVDGKHSRFHVWAGAKTKKEPDACEIGN